LPHVVPVVHRRRVSFLQRSHEAVDREEEFQMKARTFITTIGAAAALVAPAAHASSGGNALHCAAGPKPTVHHLIPLPFFSSPLNPRGLEASTSSVVGRSCAVLGAVTIAAPDRYQVLRNSL
jgi:hypothetical protein